MSVSIIYQLQFSSAFWCSLSHHCAPFSLCPCLCYTHPHLLHISCSIWGCVLTLLTCSLSKALSNLRIQDSESCSQVLGGIYWWWTHISKAIGWGPQNHTSKSPSPSSGGVHEVCYVDTVYKGWHHSAMLTILAILKILCKYSPNILQELWGTVWCSSDLHANAINLR